MLKKEEITYPNSCLNKAGPEEMVFVLRAKDPAAPTMIRMWVELRVLLGLNTYDDIKLREALAQADEMEKQRPNIEAQEKQQ